MSTTRPENGWEPGDRAHEVVRRNLPSGAVAYRAEWLDERGEPAWKRFAADVLVQPLDGLGRPFGRSERMSYRAYLAEYCGLRLEPERPRDHGCLTLRGCYG